MATATSSNGHNSARTAKWYNDDLSEAEIPDDIRAVFETYSGLPPDQVLPHILSLRSRAFELCPYPCIGQFKFLVLTLCGHPQYAAIILRLQAGERFLDLGCCFGQDLRKLVMDGAPSGNIIGLDIDGPLMDLGYDLFLDRKTLGAKFVVADMFREEGPWEELGGSIDIINASAFFHLFPWDEQIVSSVRLVQMMRPQAGVMIVGRQMGSLTPGEFPSLREGTTGFRHNVETLQKLWDQVGERTGSTWLVEGTLDTVGIMGKGDSKKDDEKERPAWAEPNMRRLLFTITRQ